MPAVRSASGPISAPACEAPISIGTPSSAMCGSFAESDIGGTFSEIVGWAKRSVPAIDDKGVDRWWARRKRAFAPPYATNARIVPLRLEIRDLCRGRQQPSARRPQFAVLVAIRFVEDFGVGHREQ